MRLLSVAAGFPALRFMVDDLALRSGPGRRVLMESRWVTAQAELQAQAGWLAQYRRALLSEGASSQMGLLEIKLERVKDIRGTLRRLGDGALLDDVEWFEVKNFALLADEISAIVAGCGISEPRLPDLKELVGLLDPEGTRIPSFYIYDAYSEVLASLRRSIRAMGDTQRDGDEFRALRGLMADEEDRLRAELTSKAAPFAADAMRALTDVARIDIFLAKARQMVQRGMCLADVAAPEGKTSYRGLFHPAVADRLAASGRVFQALDISFASEPTLITGSNMGGKSVMLQMTAMAQCLFQFGFGIPAQAASIAPVDGVAVCQAGEGDSRRGLSAFASEMMAIQNVIAPLRSGSRLLAVIDEPAQTTNPTEGAAIVSGLVELLSKLGARALITTHYGGIDAPCRRLKVKGFATTLEGLGITPENIGDYMDFSLEEDMPGGDAPHEALRVAALLGVDGQWLDEAKKKLRKNNGKSK